ncbi:MAG TPA: ribosome-associated translation inhibitor RaiA [Gemmatimonadales bacterium]|jgi:ribosomal subunit interface protein|nr:ribosome-associated translation inhibitor RaiA [Gemmatimonadales bacterium]
MQVTVTARHCEIPDPLREQARLVMARIMKAAHRPQRARVVFDVDHQQKVVEIKLHLPRGVTRIATAEATDFRTALDRAAEKLRRQLEKTNSRYVRRPAAK